MLHTPIHMLAHLLLPGGVAYIFFRRKWQKAWLIMVLTMAVDLDHLPATPVFDPSRCSIGFHPLHSHAALALYLLTAIIPPTRFIGMGLLLHMTVDLSDCLLMMG